MLFCRRFGWSWHEYSMTPADVIARWTEYAAIEAQFKKNRRRKK